MSLITLATPAAMEVMRLVFRQGLKKAVTLRKEVLNRVVAGPITEGTNYVDNDTNAGLSTAPITGITGGFRLGDKAKWFVHGWQRAGGGNLILTSHKANGGYPGFCFWDRDPEPLLTELIKVHYPNLFAMEVHES